MPASVPAIPVPFLSNVMTETSPETPAPNSENGEDSEIYLVPSPTMDFEHPAVRAFLETLELGSDPLKNAVQLYYAVRDRIRYDPYTINLSVEGLKASTTLTAGRAWCISKAILLCPLPFRRHSCPAWICRRSKPPFHRKDASVDEDGCLPLARLFEHPA